MFHVVSQSVQNNVPYIVQPSFRPFVVMRDNDQIHPIGEVDKAGKVGFMPRD